MRWVAKWVNKVHRVRKNHLFVFSKIVLDHMECQNKCFWRVLTLWWPVLSLPESQNALEMGCFATKMGQKRVKNVFFPKMILDHLGFLNNEMRTL